MHGVSIVIRGASIHERKMEEEAIWPFLFVCSFQQSGRSYVTSSCILRDSIEHHNKEKISRWPIKSCTIHIPYSIVKHTEYSMNQKCTLIFFIRILLLHDTFLITRPEP
jgi:hypothetical protein